MESDHKSSVWDARYRTEGTYADKSNRQSICDVVPNDVPISSKEQLDRVQRLGCDERDIQAAALCVHAESQVISGVGRGFLSFGREVVWSEEKTSGN